MLGVEEDERELFISQTLLALRGWAGMVWQMESNAEWAPHPAPEGSLIEFLADDGTLSREIMPDLLHLSEQGYTIWAESIEPVVKEAIGK